MDRFDWLELNAKTPTSKDTSSRRVRPHDAPSFYLAARQMREGGHMSAACDFYRKAVALNDHHFEAWSELVDALVRSRQLEAADSVSREALQNYRQVRRLYASRGLTLMHQGKMAEALPLIDLSVEERDGTWYSRCVKAEALLRMGIDNRFEAMNMFAEALEMAEAPWEVFYLAGLIMLSHNIPTLAASHFAEAAHLRPRAAICWLGLGDSFSKLRLYDQANFYYQRVLELEPTNTDAVERQKKCGALVYGLMRAFRRQSLRKRWNAEFDKIQGKQESEES